MSGSAFDSNQFLMMVNILGVSTKHLKDEAPELKIQEIEHRWKELLSTLHNCFSYAQTHEVDLREYKTDLREIVDHLYSIEKIVRDRKDGKVTVIDDIAKGIIFIASKIDDVLEGIGWKRVVRPITEAIFVIPKKIIAMFSSKTDTTPMLPEIIQQYLPPPMKTLPSGNTTQPSSTQDDDVIDVEWIEVENTEESYAKTVLRQMHDRISHIESGGE
jgi:hypothetical protein